MAKKLIIPLLGLLLLWGCKSKPESSDVNVPPPLEANEEIYEPEEESQTLQETDLMSYEYNWSKSDDMPDVVIIIDDFGNSAGQLLEDFADLPKEIVFAVLPDLPHTKTAANLASQKGHEVIIHIPMEAENSSISPGEKYISQNMQERDIEDVLNNFIKQMPMAIAANNHMGSATTASLPTITAVLSHLANKGLFFIDSATTSKSAVYTAAKNLGIFNTRRDIFLDVPDNSDATLASKIQSMGKYKGRKEPIVIISHCHNREKLEALRKFITQIEAMGLRIVALRNAFPSVRA
ncbi:MAG: divergent polysaccharide deacetylase family protein [Candidatus Cloacimonetes bacterium]|nr:divergent polysaccharide deacetylase family protein [Candidatus Cloacimonadota bacterium]